MLIACGEKHGTRRFSTARTWSVIGGSLFHVRRMILGEMPECPSI
jgi:hypothetical protein